jgi:DNA-binding MarR family transcriptional regulator
MTERVDVKINTAEFQVLIAICDNQGSYSSNVENLATYLKKPMQEVQPIVHKLYYDGYIKKTANPYCKIPSNVYIKAMRNKYYFILTKEGRKMLEFFNIL